MSYNTLLVLLGVGLLGAGAGIIGSFAVVRRRALLGDALSHAALPGLCLGFMLAGERNLPAMLLGALVTGLLGVGVVAVLRRYTRVREDAAIGVVLSVFFGAGIVLSRLIQNSTTLAGSKAGLDSYILGKTAGMVASDVVLIAGAAVAAVGLVVGLFKEFLLVSFDTGFARVQGWPVQRIDLVLTGLVAVVVVIGLPAVGVVMMAALLIIPGVTARFWSDRLARVVLLAAGIGIAMGLVGTFLSATYNKMPAGPVITLVGTALFIVSALAAPRRGLIARAWVRLRDRWQMEYDEVLRILYEAQATGRDRECDDILASKSWSRKRVRKLLVETIRTGDATSDAGPGYSLSAAGHTRAVEVVRRHRLWRCLIEECPDLVPIARPMSRQPVEDFVPPEIVADLEGKLRATGRWPEARTVDLPEGVR